ncbi:hypothetical protein D3C86_2224050 [compost metagenome]
MSAEWPSRFITMMVQMNGMALSRPMLKAPVTPVDLINVGIQNVRPYWPATKAK